jgi:hypothetical protein
MNFADEEAAIRHARRAVEGELYEGLPSVKSSKPWP